MSKPKVVVIGGGISGLTAALGLVEAGFSVKLYEEKDAVGGLIGTYRSEFGISESAANGILNSRIVENLCQRLGVPLVGTLPSARSRYVYVGNKARRWPFSLIESFSFLSKLLWYRIRGKDRIAPTSGETVTGWLTRWFGPWVDEKLLGPALLGIYASRSRELSASLVLGPLFGRPKHPKPSLRGTVAPLGGMGALIRALEERTRALGVEIFTGSTYRWELWEDGKTPHVLATSAAQAARITKAVFPVLSKGLEQIRMVPVISATLFFSKGDTALKGFGCLFSESERANSLGVLIPTCIFPGRSSVSSETWILGGAVKPEAIELSEAEILKKILEDRARLFGRRSQPLSQNIFIWKEALPIYDLYLESFLSELHLPASLFLTGNYLGKIGIAGLIEKSLNISNEILSQRGTK
ncbi:MAG: FAD-dependent oxidoreductase [Bdellovibrionales bacterium]|nr:FAD-dependent oxidoreductase [Bdellovibrionales bacterium]